MYFFFSFGLGLKKSLAWGKNSSVLNNFDFNEKRAFLLSVKILLFLEISGFQCFRENLGALLAQLLQKSMGIHLQLTYRNVSSVKNLGDKCVWKLIKDQMTKINLVVICQIWNCHQDSHSVVSFWRMTILLSICHWHRLKPTIRMPESFSWTVSKYRPKILNTNPKYQTHHPRCQMYQPKYQI